MCPRPGPPAARRKTGWRRARLAADRLDLRLPKGRPASRCSILPSSSSLAMARSPTLALRRPISWSRPAAGRVLSEPSPAARKVSRQALSSAAVTASSRDTSSRSSPRSSRSTALCLRLANIRRRLSGAGPSSPACRARFAGPAPRAVVSVMLTSLHSFTNHKAVSQLTVDRRSASQSPRAARITSHQCQHLSSFRRRLARVRKLDRRRNGFATIGDFSWGTDSAPI